MIMTSAKTDGRTERMRNLMMIAFIDLILSEGYENISVEDIAASADIGRSTFYNHYACKEAILCDAMKNPFSVLAVVLGGDVTPEQIAPQMEHFLQQRGTNRALFTPAIREMRVKVLADLMQPRLAKVARNVHGRPQLPQSLIALQIAEAQELFIYNWVFGPYAVPAIHAAEALIAATRGLLGALLRGREKAALLIPGGKIQFIRRRSKPGSKE